ncbi:hypothetical protein V1264_016808 [Littorina saxatilis]|uniref:Uncharacterized protein n=2 Tax=Littorina saxatilis TaxID=31220 RepID=A0AAN9BFY0_9CAEN
MEISDVSENFQGSYTCNVIPSDESAIQRTKHACILLVNGAHATQLVDERTCENGCSAVQVNLALLIILLLGVILIFLLVGFKLKWFSCSKVVSSLSRKRTDDAEGGVQELEHLNQPDETEAAAIEKDQPSTPMPSPSPNTSSGAEGKQHDEESKDDSHIEEGGVAENAGAENQSEMRDESRAAPKRSGCVVQ